MYIKCEPLSVRSVRIIVTFSAFLLFTTKQAFKTVPGAKTQEVKFPIKPELYTTSFLLSLNFPPKYTV